MAGTGKAHLRGPDASVLRVEDLRVVFELSRNQSVQAVSGISLDVLPGETLGVVGESGCGKSTAGRAIVQLPPPTSGSVRFEGVELTALPAEDLRRIRPRVQLVFQDPISSLNPRRTVREIVSEPLRVWRRGSESELRSMVDAVLEAVGLDPKTAGSKRVHQFSGGQCQRISIARSLVLDPSLLICDEPDSALDVSIQAQIINLLEDMKHRYGLSMVFIAHDLAVIKNVSDRIVVMYMGKLCEVGHPDSLYRSPAHPYTAALLRSIPEPKPGRVRKRLDVLAGELPSPLDPPSGCRFRTRCPRVTPYCATVEPQMRAVGPDQYVACHFPLVDPLFGPDGADPGGDVAAT